MDLDYWLIVELYHLYQRFSADAYGFKFFFSLLSIMNGTFDLLNEQLYLVSEFVGLGVDMRLSGQ